VVNYDPVIKFVCVCVYIYIYIYIYIIYVNALCSIVEVEILSEVKR